jgi:hypothetical protein
MDAVLYCCAVNGCCYEERVSPVFLPPLQAMIHIEARGEGQAASGVEGAGRGGAQLQRPALMLEGWETRRGKRGAHR